MKKSPYQLNSVTIEEYTKSVRKRNTLRWSVTLLVLVIVLFVTTLPLFLSINPTLAGISDGIAIFGGLIIVFSILLFPLRKKIQPMKQPNGENKTLKSPHTNNPYYQEVQLKVAVYIIIPLIFIFGFTIIFLYPIGGLVWALILFAALIGLFCLLLLFGSIEYFISNNMLFIKFGFIKETIPLSDIMEIEEVTIHPLKDYMGYGYRIGSDGSIGYIGSGSKEIRLILKQNTVYVLTLPNPKEFNETIKMYQ